jgi:hypothetical protein
MLKLELRSDNFESMLFKTQALKGFKLVQFSGLLLFLIPSFANLLSNQQQIILWGVTCVHR